MLKYKDNIVLEIGGHDHFGDVRVENNYTEGFYRSLLVASSITPYSGNLPGFSTFHIDGMTLKPSDLELTALDITSAYGKDVLPSFDELPFYYFNYKDFGINNLDPASLAQEYASLR